MVGICGIICKFAAMEKVFAYYREKTARHEAQAEALGKRIYLLGSLRLLLVAGLITALWLGKGESGGVLTFIVAAFVLPFVGLMVWHSRLFARKSYAEAMAQLCREENIAMTPYSALAGGRLSKKPGETSKRLEEDDYARLKYDGTAKEDGMIISRVAELAENRGVSMTEISLAWLLTKVTAPVVGATKLSHVEGMAKAAEICLTKDEITYLEEPYVPHRLVGVMAQNTADQAKEKHVWSTGNQKL